MGRPDATALEAPRLAWGVVRRLGESVTSGGLLRPTREQGAGLAWPRDDYRGAHDAWRVARADPGLRLSGTPPLEVAVEAEPL